MLDKAKGFNSDAVFLDLEDAVAPADKAAARGQVVDALQAGWGTRTRTVRVNGLETRHTYRDVIEVVEGAGAHLDAIVLPKVQGPEQVVWLDLRLTQIEPTMGLTPQRLGIDAPIATPAALQQVQAHQTPRRPLQRPALAPAPPCRRCFRGVFRFSGVAQPVLRCGPFSPLPP